MSVKWFVNEKGSDAARRIKDSYVSGKIEIIAPNLIYYEVLNALRFHPVARFTPKELFSIMTSLKNLQFTIDPTDGTWFKSFNLSLQEGISIYDSVYVGLASNQDAFVTADNRLVDMLSKSINNIIALDKLKSDLGA